MFDSALPANCAPSQKGGGSRGARPGPKRKLLLAAPLLLFTLILAACRGDSQAEPTPTATPDQGPSEPEVVSYQAEDGLRIIADFYAPLEGGPAPAVLLLHQFNGSRDQWADLVPDLLQWGFAVLAPDLRSFGQSTVILRQGTEESYELSDLDDMLMDVAAAIEYLKSRSEVEKGGIGVLGASVGGNLAYVASGAFPEVKATVSMSPSASPQGGALLGSSISGFSPRAVRFLSDEAEAADAEALAENVAEPVEVIVYEGRTAHGVELLENPQVKTDIRGWLTVNLRLGR